MSTRLALLLALVNVSCFMCMEDGEVFELTPEIKEEWFEAARDGQVEVVDALLKLGISPDIISWDDQTAIQISVLNGHVDVVELLLKNKASTGALSESSKYSLLHEAAKRGFVNIVEILLQYGMSVNMMAGDTRQIAAFSFKRGGDLIYRRPASEISTKTSVLGAAIIQGEIDVVKTLLNHGADIEMKDSLETGINWTPLERALRWGYIDIAELLLYKGASLAFLREKDKRKIMHGYYISANFRELVETSRLTVTRFLQSGFNDLFLQSINEVELPVIALEFLHEMHEDLMLTGGSRISSRDGFNLVRRINHERKRAELVQSYQRLNLAKVLYWATRNGMSTRRTPVHFLSNSRVVNTFGGVDIEVLEKLKSLVNFEFFAKSQDPELFEKFKYVREGGEPPFMIAKSNKTDEVEERPSKKQRVKF